MLKWLRWSRTHDEKAEREEDWHLAGLTAIMRFAYGLQINWSKYGKDTYREHCAWALDQSDWGRLLTGSRP